MPAVRLGKLVLRWCDACNLPILEWKQCGRCGGRTRKVPITPPGDIRPAFQFDVEMIRNVAEKQFGNGAGQLLLPEGSLVVLNKAPDVDRMDEFFADGEALGALQYVLGKGFRIALRMAGAARLAEVKKGWVVADKGAVPYILKSSNLLGPGIVGADPDIKVGDEVIVKDPEGSVVAAGTARKNGAGLLKAERGLGVKVRHRGETAHVPRPQGTWDDAVAANEKLLAMYQERGVDFIRRMVGGNELPLAVSFSGGKDSLATLLVVLEAGLRPPLLFTDTGLEFRETVQHVSEVAGRHGLELIVESAGDKFWEAVEHFGPPGKDFRWCCKTNKLGPATRLIRQRFPDGVLSFIGQRKYESQQRANKGMVWRNPWVPNQLGASPIQHWTAMHVWLYIFWKKEPYNPLYEKGLDRIGCWLCPASDMGELELVRGLHADAERWAAFLTEYGEKRGHPAEWLDYGLWRWRRPSGAVLRLLEESGVKMGTPKADDAAGLEFFSAGGYEPCSGGLSAEGVFTRALDAQRVANVLQVLGDVRVDPETGTMSVGSITVFPDGAVSVRGKDETEVRRLLARVRNVVLRAELCIGCGVCTGACPEGALTLVDGRVEVDGDRCVHCLACLEKCPVVDFDPKTEYDY